MPETSVHVLDKNREIGVSKPIPIDSPYPI